MEETEARLQVLARARRDEPVAVYPLALPTRTRYRGAVSAIGRQLPRQRACQHIRVDAAEASVAAPRMGARDVGVVDVLPSLQPAPVGRRRRRRR